MIKKITTFVFIFSLAPIALLNLGKISLAAENYNPEIDQKIPATEVDIPTSTQEEVDLSTEKNVNDINSFKRESANNENVDNIDNKINSEAIDQKDEDNYNENYEENGNGCGYKNKKEEDEEEIWVLAAGFGIGGLLAGLLVGRYKDIFSLLRRKQADSGKDAKE